MDERTRHYYATHADEVAATWERAAPGVARYFGMAFPPGARVLDIGAGTGRDVEALVGEGYAAYGTEPVEELRAIGARLRPRVAGRLAEGELPDGLPASEAMGGPFDGVVCSAVLQHLPRADLFDAVFAIRGVLMERGRALISIPVERPGLDAEGREPGGRLFNRVTPGELSLLFERVGFASIGEWANEDGLSRPGHRWVTLLFELRHVRGSRPLDLVEGVLTRDRKVATYKLALFRALADIALTQAHRAVWEADGRVSVPVDAIAERWVGYYWPLFEGPAFLPQLQGDWDTQAHRLGFAGPLRDLIDAYSRRGGLAGYLVERRSRSSRDVLPASERQLFGKLRTAIRTGPATHAGGSLESGPLFEPRGRRIAMDAALWRELALMGHWIQEALILRWAELIVRLAHGGVSLETAVGCLMRRPSGDRETADARRVYSGLGRIECVWSGRLLEPTAFVGDHVMPFALWRNNDLWNLLPADEKVNAKKSDRLPTRALLRDRRPVIATYWEASRAALPDRFAAESEAWTGQREPAEALLFATLVESVEATALQRGCERWQP